MFNFPLPLRSRSHLYRNPHRFHTSNFILLVLRWFYFILRTPPLKYFPCICTLPQSDFFLFSLSAFPRHSSTFLLVTIHLHLILLLPSLSLFSIPFPINNKTLLFLSLISVTMFRLRCFGYTSPFPTPRNRSRYLTRTSYLFLPFSSSTSHSWPVLSLPFARSLLVALTARNQYIPLHCSNPYHLSRTSTTDLHSWSWPTNPHDAATLTTSTLSFSLLPSISYVVVNC